MISKRDYSELIDRATDSAITQITRGFADTARKIGILIAMAAIIGVCLLESGAAEQVVRSMQRLCGERATAVALVLASFLLAIPVFFDTVFFLMLPIAQALARQRGGDYLKFVLAIVVGGTLAHSLVPPTPGPLFVAGELGVSLLTMMTGGIAVGIWGVLAGYAYVVWVNRMMPIPVPPNIDSTGLAPDRPGAVTASDKQPLADQLRQDVAGGERSDRLPPLWLSLLPIVLPIACLSLQPLLKACGLTPADVSAAVGLEIGRLIVLLSDKNIALVLAAAVALATFVLRPGRSGEDGQAAVGRALADGGTVILITCAGGAFGHVIRQTNIAATLAETFPEGATGFGLLWAGFLLTAIIRIAQGSATVAMITAVGIIAPIAASVSLPFHPVYLALAVGCGSKPVPWMNDSGFWTIGKMAGFTEAETLRTFTVLLTIMGIVAFAAVLLGAWLLPLV